MLHTESFGIQTAFLFVVMNILLSLYGSLAEPVRLALMGTSLILVAVFLRKVLAPSHPSLTNTAKAEISSK